MGLNAPPQQKGRPLLFSSEGSSQAFADRLAGALTSQRFKDTKTIGEASRGRGWRGGRWQRRMTCQMRKKTY